MIRRALVFLPRCVGDTLVATPMLRQLRKLNPSVSTHVVCSGGGKAVLANNPNVAQVMVTPRGRAGIKAGAGLVAEAWRNPYDLLIDASARVKTALLTRLSGAPRRHGWQRRWPRNEACYTYSIDRNGLEYMACFRLRLLGDDRISLNDLQLDFPTSASDQQEARDFALNKFERPVAAMYAGSTKESRKWPLAKSAEMGRRLMEHGMQVLLLHGPGQLEEARQLGKQIGGDCIADYATQSLPVMKEVLSRCALYIGNDGGPKHIARAAGIPTVGVFGSAPAPRWTEPHRSDQRFVNPFLTCDLSDYFGTITDAPTIAEISVDQVWHEVESLFSAGHVGQEKRRWAA